jgi:hypothetical protein
MQHHIAEGWLRNQVRRFDPRRRNSPAPRDNKPVAKPASAGLVHEAAGAYENHEQHPAGEREHLLRRFAGSTANITDRNGKAENVMSGRIMSQRFATLEQL